MENVFEKKPVVLNMDAAQRETLFKNIIENTRTMMGDRYDAVNAPNMALFFENELESIENTLYETVHEENNYAEDVVVDSSDPQGAETVGFIMSDMVGKAKIINRNSNDIPKATTFMRKYTENVHTLGLGADWSYWDIANAMLAGRPLEKQYIEAVRQGHMDAINEFFYEGDTGLNAAGLVNNPSITVTASIAGAVSSATALTAMTSADIIAWFGYYRQLINTACGRNRRASADTVRLPGKQYDVLATKMVDTGNGSNVFLLDLLLNAKGMGFKSIEPRDVLSGKAANGSDDRAVFYNSTKEALVYKIPAMMVPFPIFQQGSRFTLEVHTRLAPVQFRYEIGAMYVDGM